MLNDFQFKKLEQFQASRWAADMLCIWLYTSFVQLYMKNSKRQEHSIVRYFKTS